MTGPGVPEPPNESVEVNPLAWSAYALALEAQIAELKAYISIIEGELGDEQQRAEFYEREARPARDGF